MSLSLSLHYVPGAEVRNCPSKERCPWSWLCGSGRGSLLTCSSSSRRLRLACLRLALVCVIPGVGLRQVFAACSAGAVRVGRSTKSDLELQILPANGGGVVKCTKLLPSGQMELQQYKDFVMKASTPEERDEW